MQSPPFYAILAAMNAITFDTHKFITKLKNSGFEEQQAEALVSAFQEATGEVDLVTKEYFDIRLKGEIDVLTTRLNIIEKTQWIIVAGVLALVLKTFLSS